MHTPSLGAEGFRVPCSFKFKLLVYNYYMIDLHLTYTPISTSDMNINM